VLLAVNPLDAHSLISAFGTAGVIAIIFAETGILLGIFLPGDSLLFTAGFFAAGRHSGIHLPLAALLPGTAVAAIAGAQVGYHIGRTAGPALFRRPDSRLFKAAYVERAREFIDRYGTGKALFLARFVPIVRTLMFPFAGVLRVDQRRFVMWNVVGGLVWTQLVVMLGFALGSSLKGTSIDTYILPIVFGIAILSVIPVLLEIRRRSTKRT